MVHLIQCVGPLVGDHGRGDDDDDNDNDAGDDIVILA